MVEVVHPLPAPQEDRADSARLSSENEPRSAFVILVDGEEVVAYPGETIAAAIWAAGRRAFRKSAKTHEPRSMLCGIGVCHECVMTVDGRPNVRICLELVHPGSRIESQDGFPPVPVGDPERHR